MNRPTSSKAVAALAAGLLALGVAACEMDGEVSETDLEQPNLGG